MGQGELALIVRRPAEGEREVLSEATLDETEGMVGDRWRATDFGDGPERFDTVELSLAADDLPPGSRLEIGSALSRSPPCRTRAAASSSGASASTR